MKILIVDDEPISRKKLSVLLGKKGQCDTAEEGMEAFSMFCRAYAADAPYDLITLDFNMPGLNGPDVLQKIRDFEKDKGIVSRDKWVKVVMVTGKNDTRSVMSSYTSGCDGYLTKPFNQEDIRKSLAEIKL